MPQLIDPKDLLAHPLSPHALLFKLVGELADHYGEPVRHETLQWYTDVLDAQVDPNGALAALDDGLGPRPRRARLITFLGDLVDVGLLRQEPAGLWITPLGRELLADLAGTTGFDAVVPIPA